MVGMPYLLKNGKTIDLLNINRADLLDDSVSEEEALEIKALLEGLIAGMEQ